MLDEPEQAQTDKPTTQDLARAAGVSLATVDRVLNGRPGVRAVTIERVQAAIQQIGYVRDLTAANLARRRFYNFLFILPDSNNEFIASLEAQIRLVAAISGSDRTTTQIKRVKAFNPKEVTETIGSIDAEQYEGVAVFGLETPSVRDAIDALKKRGLAVVSLVSDLPSSERDHFVGIDNIAAGKTAAQLLGRFLPKPTGKVLVITGSRLARDHIERRHGFDAVMAEAFPDLTILPSLEGLDDPEHLFTKLPHVFEANPDICGIYSSAGGNQGLVRFLREQAMGDRLSVVGHELTEISRGALEDGTFDAIISQDPGHIVRSCVRLLRAQVDGVAFDPTQERIRIDIYLKENMPEQIEADEFQHSNGRQR